MNTRTPKETPLFLKRRMRSLIEITPNKIPTNHNIITHTSKPTLKRRRAKWVYIRIKLVNNTSRNTTNQISTHPNGRIKPRSTPKSTQNHIITHVSPSRTNQSSSKSQRRLRKRDNSTKRFKEQLSRIQENFTKLAKII